VRHDLFEAYKATRMKADDDSSRSSKGRRKYSGFWHPDVFDAGYEADDVVGTIVHEIGARSDIETISRRGYGHAAACSRHACAFLPLRKGITDTVIYERGRV